MRRRPRSPAQALLRLLGLIALSLVTVAVVVWYRLMGRREEARGMMAELRDEWAR